MYHQTKFESPPFQDVDRLYFKCFETIMENQPVNNEWFIKGLPFIANDSQRQVSDWLRLKGYCLELVPSGICIKIIKQQKTTEDIDK